MIGGNMFRLLITCTLLLCSVAISSADTLKLTIKDAISKALENNNQIKAASFTSKATAQGIQSANASFLPTVSFEETLAVSNSPTSTFMMKLDEGRFTSNDLQVSSLNNPAVSHDFKPLCQLSNRSLFRLSSR